MCGIAGIIGLQGKTFYGANSIISMVKTMRHRGPDDEGYILTQPNTQKVEIAYGNETAKREEIPHVYRPIKHINEYMNTSMNAILGHRRLSILDLQATGHQPMSDKTGRYWLVYNGEIYNYREIRVELENLGRTFYSQTDTEVLLQAYIEWGENALHKFNGMFAFALWDMKEQSIFIARDRVGIKPFYYTFSEGHFIFASDIKTLLASGLYTPSVNLEGLYHTMSYGAAPRPMTCFKDIISLEAGYWMKLYSNTGKLVKNQYWEIPINCEDNSLTEKQWVDLLEEFLQKSVNYQLISDVPVGTFMSGGIDSTTISAMAAKTHPHIKAFTLGYEDRAAEKNNEIEEARATAALYDMKHMISLVNSESVLQYIDKTVENYEEPFFSLSPNYIISKIVSENGIKVILNGLGGDELFAGYQTFHMAKYHRHFKLLYPILKCAKVIYPRLERTMDMQYIRSTGDLHGAIMNNMSSYQKNNLFVDESVKHLRSLETIRNLYLPKDKIFSNHMEAMCYMYMKNYIGNHHLSRLDKFTMAFSVEGRFPFLDHHFIELAFRIPAHYKMNAGVGKYILRQVAKKYIHPSSLEMKKKGFSLPMDYWIRHVLEDFVKEKLDKLMTRDLFHAKAIQKIRKDFKYKITDHYTLWQLVGIELWLEKFL